MASKIEIANRALVRLGAARISSLDENSANARAVKDAFDFVAEEVMASHTWNSITTRTSLAKLSEDPLWEYEKQYPLPGDYLRMVEIDSIDPDEPWAVEQFKDSSNNIHKVLLVDLATPVNIRYVRNETNTGRWGIHLASTVAARLSVELVEQLGKSGRTREQMERMHERVFAQARKVDAQEGGVHAIAQSKWISER